MKMFRYCLLALTLVLVMGSTAQARPDIINLFIEAVLTKDTETLQKILAANYLHINGNGYLQDKENFIENIKSGKMRIDRMTITDVASSHFGDATLVTGTVIFRGKFVPKLPEGVQRVTVVAERKGEEEKILLFQATPVRGKAEKEKAEKKQ